MSLAAPTGKANREGLEVLRKAILLRAPEAPFEAGALERIIDASGGLMRDLMRLVSKSALIALTDRADRIRERHVRQAIDDIANDYRRVLGTSDYEELRSVRQVKQITPSEKVRQLLGNLSLLEYRNEQAWCDVHPIVQQLL